MSANSSVDNYMTRPDYEDMRQLMRRYTDDPEHPLDDVELQDMHTLLRMFADAMGSGEYVRIMSGEEADDCEKHCKRLVKMWDIPHNGWNVFLKRFQQVLVIAAVVVLVVAGWYWRKEAGFMQSK